MTGDIEGVGESELYDPLLYALVHRGTPGDLAFYREQCAGADSVLELGCGFGRLVVELLEAGHRVTGLDLHAGLLDMARQAVAELPETVRAGAELKRMDMRNFSLGTRFDRILVPHSGLYCLLSEEDVEACLRAARAHLAPSGKLVLDAYAADGFHDVSLPEDVSEDHLEEVALIACDGVVYDVYERSRWDRSAQRMLATYVYVPDGQREAALDFAIDQRYLLREQLEVLLRRTGYEVVSVHGDFEGAVYDEDSDALVVVAEAAAEK